MTSISWSYEYRQVPKRLVYKYMYYTANDTQRNMSVA